jgi:hypothetical protein
MQALSKLRCVKVGCSDARCFAASPLGLIPSIATSKDRVGCEANRIGATGVGILLLTRTSICVGARTAQSA